MSKITNKDKQIEEKIQKIVSEASVALSEEELSAICLLEHEAETNQSLAELLKRGLIKVSNRRRDGQQAQEVSDLAFSKIEEGNNDAGKIIINHLKKFGSGGAGLTFEELAAEVDLTDSDLFQKLQKMVHNGEIHTATGEDEILRYFPPG